jgi:Fe2+ transport system protein FeoA
MSATQSLSDFKNGQTVLLEKFNLEPDAKLRLTELGISNKSFLKILKNNLIGPIIIQTDESVVALHRKLAENIEVSKVE